MTDTFELRKRMSMAGLRHRDVATALGLSLTSFANKLNNRSEFKESEIKKLIPLLNLSTDAVMQIFFN